MSADTFRMGGRQGRGDPARGRHPSPVFDPIAAHVIDTTSSAYGHGRRLAPPASAVLGLAMDLWVREQRRRGLAAADRVIRCVWGWM